MKQDDRSASLPSRRLAEELRDAIVSGTLAPGDKVPSERELASEHGVARNTAREAVRLIADQGLVTAQHGRGVFVRSKPRLMRFGQSRYSRKLREQTGLSPFHAEVQAQGQVANACATSIARAVPPPSVAQRLGVDPGDQNVVRRENWYFANAEPVQVGVTYVPWTIAEGTVLATTDDLGPGDLYARFEERGHSITYTREEVTARMPTPDETRDLRIPDGVPVLVVLHTGLDQTRQPFEVTEFVMRADHTGVDYTMAVDE